MERRPGQVMVRIGAHSPGRGSELRTRFPDKMPWAQKIFVTLGAVEHPKELGTKPGWRASARRWLRHAWICLSPAATAGPASTRTENCKEESHANP